MIAREIFSDILTGLMDRRGIKTQFQLVRDDGPREIWDELIASNESIIAAKLGPVREALQAGIKCALLVGHEAAEHLIRQALAMFEEE